MQTAFTDIFIKRPVLSIVVSSLIVIAGLQAISSLTVRQYPRNENAKVTITTAYVGADADQRTVLGRVDPGLGRRRGSEACQREEEGAEERGAGRIHGCLRGANDRFPV